MARRIAVERWVHLAVVLDAAKRTLTTYADGKQVGRAANVTLTLEDILDQADSGRNRLFIGRSQYDTDQTANARFHDVRIYSIALTDAQVATIHRNTNSRDASDASNASTATRVAVAAAIRPP